MNETEEKTNLMASFLKESFRVDGDVVFDRFTEIERDDNILKGALFEINDSIRGKWFIAWIK